MPPKKDVPVKKPAGPSIAKPAPKPAAGTPPAKTKAEPAVPQATVKTQEPPVDLSKVVVSSGEGRREFRGHGSRVEYNVGYGEYSR